MEAGVVGTPFEALVGGVLVDDGVGEQGYRHLVLQQERGRRKVNVGPQADGMAAPEMGRRVRLRVRCYPRVTGGKPWTSLEWLGSFDYLEGGE